MPRATKTKSPSNGSQIKKDHAELLEALRRIVGPCETHDKMASCRHDCVRCNAIAEGRRILYEYDHGLK